MTTWLIPCTIAMRRAKEPMRGKPRKLTTSTAEKRPIDRHRPRVVAWSASPVGPQLKPGQLVMGRFRPSCLSCYNPEIKHCNWESPILEDFTIKTSINWGFSTATFDYQRVYVLLICQSFFLLGGKKRHRKSNRTDSNMLPGAGPKTGSPPYLRSRRRWRRPPRRRRRRRPRRDSSGPRRWRRLPGAPGAKGFESWNDAYLYNTHTHTHIYIYHIYNDIYIYTYKDIP